MLSRSDYHVYSGLYTIAILHDPFVKYLDKFHFVIGRQLVYACRESSNHV
jgi:hypothetical protein